MNILAWKSSPRTSQSHLAVKEKKNIPISPLTPRKAEGESIGGTIPTSRRRMRMRSSVLRLTQKKSVSTLFPLLKTNST